MPKVTASEYAGNVGFYQDAAQREPVIIIEHGQEQAVLMSAEEYRRLTRRRRRPYLIEDLPEEDWQAIEAARAEFLAGAAAEV